MLDGKHGASQEREKFLLIAIEDTSHWLNKHVQLISQREDTGYECWAEETVSEIEHIGESLVERAR